MIAPCGINCSECNICKAANDPAFAVELAQQWRDGGMTDVTPEWFVCKGCNGPAELLWSGDCKIRECCYNERHLNNCSEYTDFPCELITNFENDPYPHHTKAVQYLRQLRESR